ncbi:MAG: acylphosphatase, partial [Actinomycetia bacterium]|nr:acylphosphatase [Actinomycetes bacterium]
QVGFRIGMLREAELAGLAGWCRNLPDGRVAFAVEGPAPAVRTLLDWVRAGPRYGQVEEVQTRQVPPTGEKGFEIR